MIRALKPGDPPRVMEIWLTGNLQAHSFIPESYWKGHFESVQALLPQAEVFVFADDLTRRIEGFIGLTGREISGIFVAEDARSQGIGRELLAYAKERRPSLTLHVYAQNQRAMQFYRREDFRIQAEERDEQTGALEYEMVWTPSGVHTDAPPPAGGSAAPGMPQRRSDTGASAQ